MSTQIHYGGLFYEEGRSFLVLSGFRLAPVICDYCFLFVIKVVR